MQNSTTDRLFSREFAILCVSAMVFFVAMGASSPLMPKFVVDELHSTKLIAGFVVGSVAVSSLCLRSWFGRLGGQRGSRLLIISGCLLGSFGMAVMIMPSNIPLTVAGRLFVGAGQAAMMTGATVLAIDLAPSHRRGEGASYVMVAFHLGLGTGPVIGEAVLRLSSYRIVWLTLTLLLLVAAAVAFCLPHRGGHPDAPRSPWVHPSGIAPGLVASFGVIAFVSFSFMVPLYGREIGMNEVGLVFAVASISIALARLFMSRLPDRVGPIVAGTIAISLTLCGALVAALWSSIAGVYVAAGIMAAGMALQVPALIPAVIEAVKEHDRSSAMATFTMFIDFSVAITAPIFGFLVTSIGYRSSFLISASTSGVALVLLHVVLSPRWTAAIHQRTV